VNAPVDPPDLLSRSRLGDEVAFTAVIAPYERSLFRHCYRMLGSGPDAEEALQDTLFRAWRRFDTFDGSGQLGGWLYRIATNVCLDALRSKRTRIDPVSLGPPSASGTAPSAPDPELTWIEPVADADLVSLDDPQADVLRREDISLAFVAALQRLAPRQRACLLLHDVLGFTQAEVADALEMTPSSVNSLLFRARQAARPRGGETPMAVSDPRVQELLERYLEAWRLADIDAFVALVADDVRFSMPPLSEWFEGVGDVMRFVEHAIFSAVRPNGVTLCAGRCNGQPAFAVYQPGPDRTLVVTGLQILAIGEKEGQPVVTDIVSYRDPGLALRCGLPERIGSD
jgi:RNA polymerase sigma-70 factor (TIGR02960 family)